MLQMIRGATASLDGQISTISLVLMPPPPHFSRLSMWLRNRQRRDLDGVSVEKTEELQHFIRPEDIRDTLLPHSR